MGWKLYMISNATKELINLAISKLELENPTQIVINEAVEHLKRAIEQVKNEKNQIIISISIKTGYNTLRL